METQDIKEILFFIFRMLIIVVLPKILTCISAGKLLELTKINPKLCSNELNAKNPYICSEKDIKNEITFIDKHNSIKDELKNISKDRLKDIAIVTITLAVISIIITLIVYTITWINGADRWLFRKYNRSTFQEITFYLYLLGRIVELISFTLLSVCYGYIRSVFEHHEKKEEYNTFFIITIVLEILLFLIGVYLFNKTEFGIYSFNKTKIR
jgi:hypothetical protein